jgi:uncharacterized membrane protein YedE/YeeE
MIDPVPPWAACCLGIAAGALCGATTQRARFCTFGAIEDALVSGNTLRLRAFALALAGALAGTQIMIAAGLLPTADMALLPPLLPWAGALFGGVLFGVGMALVGTCPFGALVRLGAGDLRALVVLLAFGAVAWATASGGLAGLRFRVLDPLALPLSAGGGTDLARLAGLEGLRLLVGLAVAAGLLAWALADARLRRAPRLLLAGLALGGSVCAGWLVTGVLADPFLAAPRPQGLSFVAPVARLLQAFVLQPAPLLEFGMGAVAGVAAGALLAAWRHDELRWEAFDDHREMRRHLLGAVLMGIGGIWAGGCTIGQGLSAGSLLAPSWPLSVGGIIAGAWLGIGILLEGRAFPPLRWLAGRRG